MPTWADLNRGYYDPTYGTYISPDRVDWTQTARQNWSSYLPAEVLNGYYDPRFGTYMPSDQYDWSYVGQQLGLPAPQRVVMGRPGALSGFAPAQVQRGVDAASSALVGQWQRAADQYAPRVEAGITRAADALVNAWGAQAPAPSSGYAPPSQEPYGARWTTPASNTPRIMGALGQATQEPNAWQAPEPPKAQEYRGPHPPNAVYVSDDGLVSYDAAGYRLDSLGNRALGDPGAHLWS